jgi:hypothetical protein
VLAAPGPLRAAAEESEPISEIWTSLYGWALAAATCLPLLLLRFGRLIRRRLIPRLARAWAALRGTSVALAALAAVLLAVALVTELKPGRDAAAAPVARRLAAGGAPLKLPSADAVVRAQESGSLGVTVAAKRAGRVVDVQVTVLSPNGGGKTGLHIHTGAPGSLKPASPCGAGCYSATMPLRQPLVVAVRGAGAPLRFEFGRRFPTRHADGLMRRATTAYRSLRSATYVERLASSPTNALVTNFAIERPNRVRFHTPGGHSAIIVGAKRWDRDPGRPWVESQQSPLVQPTPTWRTALTNAYVLAATPAYYELSFIDRTSTMYPAWFELRLDRQTLLPKTLAMTATAHFMFQQYTGYNRLLNIHPPRKS